MKYLFFIVLLVTSFMANAQMPSPVKWSAEYQSDADGQWIVLDAKMDEGWVVYSQFMTDDGPVPTTIRYSYDTMELVGDTEELSPMIKKYSELFEMEVKKFKHEALFKQKIKVDGHGIIKVSVNFMTCNGGSCLPPKTETIMVKFKA